MPNNNCNERLEGYHTKGSIIYNKTHKLDVFCNGPNETKNVYITLISFEHFVAVKVRDVHDYSFNYETKIDWSVFEKMRIEQNLETTFEEIHLQIIELLNDISNNECFLKLEISDSKCKLVFYGRSKIKCIIFLTIDLKPTNSREIIREMTSSILNLKEKNDHLAREITSLKNELVSKETFIRDANHKRTCIEKEFYKQLDAIYGLAVIEQNKIENMLNNELQKLTKCIQKMLLQINAIKEKNILKQQANSQLVQSMQNLKLENERNASLIGVLKNDIQNLNSINTKLEKSYSDLKWIADQKDRRIEELEKQTAELQNDLKEATKIIAQKTRINDEIAKDLVQANQMLVNFNFHFDKMSKESDEQNEQLKLKESLIEEQRGRIKSLSQELASYKDMYNSEEFKKLKQQLSQSKQQIEELEKQNREANMLNNVLTRKLSASNAYEPKNLGNLLRM